MANLPSSVRQRMADTCRLFGLVILGVLLAPLCGCKQDRFAAKAASVESQCLAQHGGPEWPRLASRFDSLEDYCRDKAAYMRAQMMKREAPNLLRSQHSEAEQHLNDIRSQESDTDAHGASK